MTTEEKLLKLAQKVAEEAEKNKSKKVVEKGEYATLKNDKERIAYIAKVLGLTE